MSNLRIFLLGVVRALVAWLAPVVTPAVVLVVVMALFPAPLLAQGEGVGYSMRRISSASGLPSNTVHCMAQDGRGYIWIGTSNGLCRYDGFNAMSLRDISCDPKVYIEPNIGEVECDEKRGLVWVFTSAGIVGCFDVRQSRFVDYTGRGEYLRQYGQWMLADGGLWLYGNGDGVRHVDRRGGRFSVVDYSERAGNLPSDDVRRVAADSAGNVWLLTARGALAVTPGGKAVALGAGRNMAGCAPVGGGMALVGADGSIGIYDGRLRLSRRLRADGVGVRGAGRLTHCCEWRGQLLLFTAGGTLAVDMATGRQYRPDSLQIAGAVACPGSSPGWQAVANGSGDVLTLRSDGLASRFNLLPGGRNPSQGGVKIRVAAAGKALYIATNGNGLFCLDPARGAMPSRVEEPAGTDALSYMLLCIMATGDGTLLVGNEAAGVTCVIPGRQTQARYILPEPGGMGSLANTVRQIATRGDGKMFVSTKDNAIYDYNPATGGLLATGRLRACAYAFFTDRHGHTYLGTRGDGLYVDGLRYATDETARHIPSNDIYDVAQDGRGRIYVATWDGGLLVADSPGERPLRFRAMLNRTRDERRVRRVCIDGRGRAWVATCNGLYTADTRQGRIDNASFTRLAAADGSLPATNIICLTVARDGNVYAGGLGCGLIKVIPGKGAARPGYEQITMAQGLVNDNVRSVVEDRYGYIWAGTEEGVSRVNPSNNTATSYRFGTTLEGNICSEGAAAVAPDGTLLFGTFGGMLAVSPVNPERDMTRARPPLITNIMVNGLEPWQDTALAAMAYGAGMSGIIELGHDQGNITLCFSNMDYANAESSFFMYRLEGEDRQWHTANGRAVARYANLRPGKYTFRVRAMTADTRWSPDTTLAITILQPWWLRWWAWLVYAVTLAALSAWLYSLWLRGFRLRQQVLTERRMGEFRLNLFTQIAHEFRTPLALIQGAADRLARNDGRPPSRSALQTVRRGTLRLLRQVNMLMEFRRISTGNARLQLVRGDIVGFARGIYMDFFSAARQKEVAFTMVPFGRDYTMAFDRRMVETMVYNLLSNAIKYVPRRGSVTLRLRLDGRKVLISVEDSGPGLSEEQQKNLFSPFMHGYVGSGGMGIGLYTARQMALLHKGDLTYGRAAGLTVFTVELPADESVYAAGDYGAEPPADETGSPGAGGDVRELLPEPLNDVTVAIVEDDPDMMEQLRTEIGAYFRTECYPDGESAADGLAASGVALVVCDVMLPGIDGYELVRRLRHNAATASVPVIMLTALDDDEHALRGYKAGADDYMGKPCNFVLLAAKAARLIAWRSHGRAEAAGGRPEAQGGVVTARADRVFMDSVRRVVEARLGEPGFGVDQLADAMCMGRTKLYGRMKELFGTTPNRYILDVRLEVAARLLSEGRLTASEAGYKVGMDNRSYFFKCFKEKYGVPPGKYARG